MGELAKTDQKVYEIEKIIEKTDFSSKLSNDECAIVKASMYPPAISMNRKEFVTQLNKLILKTILDSGFKFSVDEDEEKEEKANLMLSVADDILRDFKHLTLEEIKICFRNGVREKYGKFYGLSVITFYNWLRKYSTMQRGKALIKQRQYEADQERLRLEKEYSQQDKNQIAHDAVIRVLTHWQENNEIYDIANSTYDTLDNLQILKLDKAKKIEIFNRAKQQVLKKKTDPKLAIKKKDIKTIIKNISEENKDGKWLIEKQAKEIALTEFFESIKKSGSVDKFKKLLKEKLGIK